MAYEAPKITEVGTVRGLTRGGYNIFDWSDEIRLWKDVTIPAPGKFS